MALTEALEVQLVFQQVVEGPAILRTVAVVDLHMESAVCRPMLGAESEAYLVVRAHHTPYTGSHGVCEWPVPHQHICRAHSVASRLTADRIHA